MSKLPAILSLMVLGLSACSEHGFLEQVDVQQQHIEANTATELRIDTARSDVQLIGEEGISEVSVEVKVLAPSVAAGSLVETVLNELQFHVEDAGDAIVIDVNIPDNVGLGFLLDVTIHAPSDMIARIHDGSGDLNITSFAGADVQDGSGDVFIENIDGRVEVIDGSGDLEVHQVSGDVLIEDDSGDVRIEDVSGNVDVEDASGDINVTVVDGSVVVADQSGDVNVSGVTGNVDVSDQSGDINLTDVGSYNILEDGSGDVNVN